MSNTCFEQQHPRQPDGKFTPKGKAESSGVNLEEENSIRHYVSDAYHKCYQKMAQASANPDLYRLERKPSKKYEDLQPRKTRNILTARAEQMGLTNLRYNLYQAKGGRFALDNTGTHGFITNLDNGKTVYIDTEKSVTGRVMFRLVKNDHDYSGYTNVWGARENDVWTIGVIGLLS